MTLTNWKRKLYVNGDYLGEITDIHFDYDTLSVKTGEDEELGFETILTFYNSCITDLQLNKDQLILNTQNPLLKKNVNKL